MEINSEKNFPRFFKDLESFYPEEVSKIPEIDAENAIIYGLPCIKIEKGYPYEGVIYLSESLSDYITFSNKTQENTERLCIKNIHQMTFKKDTDNLKGYKSKNEKEFFFQILIGQKFYDFSMTSKEQLSLAIKGLLSIFTKKEIESDNTIDGHLTLLINKYDFDSDNKFDDEELKYLSNKLGISTKLLKKDLDVNHDGVISQDELIQYLKAKTSGEHLNDIFKKYSTLYENNNNKEYYMTPLNLKNFFNEVEEEPISDLEAYQILIYFKRGLDVNIKRKINKKIYNHYIKNKKEINDEKIKEIIENVRKKNNIEKEIELNLNLREFYYMLNSALIIVYNTDKMQQKLDLNRPLTDYFIKSSHNTYITGHQLSGTSSAKMYSLSLIEGYRLVELDCYNGSGDDVVITHGYTLVSKLKLDDILKELKESAFINSPMPVILSIENHMDEHHQNIMAKKLQEILGDLYIFPSETKPEFLPTLNDMKNKFIIKVGGKRIWQNEDIKRAEIKQENKNENKKEKIKKYIYFDDLKDVVDSDEEGLEIEKKESKDDNDEEEERNLEKLRKIFELDIKKVDVKKSYQRVRKYSLDTQTKSKSKELIPEEKEIERKETKEKSKEEEKEIDEEDEKEDKIIQSLEKIRGLPGTSFKSKEIEKKHYQPWECLTIKDKKFMKYYSDKKKYKNILKLSQHCVLKAYPTSFSSRNYDIIKCWLCGCQIAALNIQALEDDYTLFNTVFFWQNKRCGFVLKPDKLLNPNFELNKDEDNYVLKLKIISCYNLVNLLEKGEDAIIEKANLQIEIYSLGSDNDDKNPHKKFDIKGGLMFPEINDKHKIEYEIPIYEKDLGGIMIKFNYGGKMFGRGCIPYCLMKNGYRRIPIFDNECYICDGAFVLGYFNIAKKEKKEEKKDKKEKEKEKEKDKKKEKEENKEKKDK